MIGADVEKLADEVLRSLKCLHDICVDDAKKLEFDASNPRDSSLMLLYGAILELSTSIILLIDQRIEVAVNVLLRSLLEAHIDFSNLAEDPNYRWNLQAAYCKQRLKMLKAAKGGGIPILHLLAKERSLDGEIESMVKELKMLQDDGYKELRVVDKFDRAGRIGEYRSIYHWLSSHSHHDIGAMDRRSVEGEKEKFDIIFYRGPNLSSLATSMFSTVTWLSGATARVHEIFGSEVSDEMSDILDELIRLSDELGEALP